MRLFSVRIMRNQHAQEIYVQRCNWSIKRTFLQNFFICEELFCRFRSNIFTLSFNTESSIFLVHSRESHSQNKRFLKARSIFKFVRFLGTYCPISTNYLKFMRIRCVSLNFKLQKAVRSLLVVRQGKISILFQHSIFILHI